MLIIENKTFIKRVRFLIKTIAHKQMLYYLCNRKTRWL